MPARASGRCCRRAGLNSAVPVAIALGSNLGDRQAHLDHAFQRLRALLSDVRQSSPIETSPVDMPGDAQPFLNAAVVGWTTLPARALLDELLLIERERGRERPFRHASRTLDLDLILYGDKQLNEPGLTVPHPAFRTRAFVLEPLVEIAPEWRDPVTGLTLAALRARLPQVR
jgi:2-amino-4-hydroxy-6-hydroxymethyldihydropteridine diphosphokinase